jgi:lipopolysaccharide/colanic/teichoic acid biosynthesis glycosyltransferase
MQRIFDIIFSTLALLVLSPLLLPIAIVLRLTGKARYFSCKAASVGAVSRSICISL